MEKKEEIIKTLDELSKGACMGVDAINLIIDKVQKKEFKEVLKIQREEYEKVKNEIKNIYKNYSDEEPHETSVMNKAMTWSGIEMKTMADDSDSHIAEILLQGTNMGIIEGRRLLNNKKINEEVDKIISDFVKMQEKAVEELKKYL